MGPGGYPGKWHPLLCSDAASAARLRRYLLLERALRCCVPTLRAQPVGRQAASHDAPRSLPLTHGRPPTVRVPIAGAIASSGAAKGRLLYQRRLSVIFSRCAPVQGCHGGLTPPALVLRRERLPAKNDFCDARTHVRRSGGRQPAVGVGKMFTQTKARLFGRPPRVRVPITVAFASRENTGGLTPPALGERTHIVGDARLRFATAFCFTRGANAPPRSYAAVRTFAGEKRFLQCTYARPAKSGGREPAVGIGIALATPIPLTSGDTRHVRRQERRA
jgi:hypothetical protein